MVKDAEAHAKDDHERRRTIEVRNNADHLAYTTEKNLREYGEKMEAADKAAIESGLEGLREALKGSDTGAIEAAVERLTQASHKMAESIYKNAASQAQAQQAGPTAESAHAETDGGQGGKTMDADFTVVDEDKDH